MRRFTILLLALPLFISMIAPVAASAQGNAAEDEYTEGVPGGGGETPSGDTGSGSPLPPDVAGEFANAGADGAAAAELAQSGGGPGSGGSGADGSGTQGAGLADASSGDDASVGAGNEGGVSAALKEIISPDSDSGMGIWLPLILGLTLVAALVAAIARMRSTRTPA